MKIQFELPQLPILPIAAGVVLALHLVASLMRPSDPAVTLGGMVACCAVAIYACILRGQNSGGVLRARWRLIALSFVFNIIASLLLFYKVDIVGVPAFHVGVFEFAAFLRGVPLLMALVMPESNRQAGADSKLSLWVAAVQAFLFVVLAYFTVFFALPDGVVAAVPNTTFPTTANYIAEYGVLAIAYMLRLMARSSARWTVFYRGVSMYLWATCCALFFIGEIAIKRWGAPAGSPLYLVFDLILLLFALYTGRFTPAVKLPRSAPRVLFVNLAGPVVFPLVIFALAIVLARTQFYWGIGAMGLSLALFAMRTTILQSGYRRIQQQLLEDNQLTLLEARIDQLTGVPNRRSFDRTMDREWRRAERTQSQLGLLMIDVDKFKHLNDTQGHPAGDRCLKRIAGVIDSTLGRATDFVARYGGEEFAVILTDTSPQDIRAIAESLRAAVNAAQFPNQTEIGQFVSCSIGAAITVPGPPLTPSSLLTGADKALYEAKRNGRNRVEFTNLLAAPSLRDQTNGALNTLMNAYKESLYGAEHDPLASKSQIKEAKSKFAAVATDDK
ncbi:GGDEF domain-containing protein [Granulicella rosea]|nr:GGDEF domain-containing protein [Granulicella rosea]